MNEDLDPNANFNYSCFLSQTKYAFTTFIFIKNSQNQPSQFIRLDIKKYQYTLRCKRIPLQSFQWHRRFRLILSYGKYVIVLVLF